MPSYSLTRLIHLLFSSATLPFSFILNEGTVGIFFFIGSSFSISFKAILPNNFPIKDCLYFFLPKAISSHCEQCFIICETFILPHPAVLFSLRELILLINSSLTALSKTVFIFCLL